LFWAFKLGTDVLLLPTSKKSVDGAKFKFRVKKNVFAASVAFETLRDRLLKFVISFFAGLN